MKPSHITVTLKSNEISMTLTQHLRQALVSPFLLCLLSLQFQTLWQQSERACETICHRNTQIILKQRCGHKKLES